MADTKISALSDIGTPTDFDELAVNDGGSSKRMTLNALVAYLDQRGRVNNTSVTNQTGMATDTYLVGSNTLIPIGRLQAKSMYRCRWNAVKTAAGTATPIVQVRLGTNGSTADTSRVTHTFAAQTAAVDEAHFEVRVTFRTVGSGTAAVIASTAILHHRLATTGFNNAGGSDNEVGVSGGFDSTVSNLQIGLSVNGGTSASWTITQVQSELFNLV